MQNRIISVGIVDGSTEILGPVGDLDPKELQGVISVISDLEEEVADLKADFTQLETDISILKTFHSK